MSGVRGGRKVECLAARLAYRAARNKSQRAIVLRWHRVPGRGGWLGWGRVCVLAWRIVSMSADTASEWDAERARWRAVSYDHT